MRRNGARVGRRVSGPAPSLEAQFSKLFVAGTDYRFDYDRRSGTTAIDYYDATHTLSATAGVPTLNASSSRFLGRPTLTCGGAVTLASNRAPAAWKHLHDGTGGSLYAISARSGAGSSPILFITRVAGVDPGAMFRSNTGDDTGVLYVTDAAGATVYLNLAIGNGWINTSPAFPTVHYYSYSESRSPKMRLRQRNLDQVSTSALGAPSNANPSGPLTMMVGANAELCSVFGFRRVHTAVEEGIVAAFVLQRWGQRLL